MTSASRNSFAFRSETLPDSPPPSILSAPEGTVARENHRATGSVASVVRAVGVPPAKKETVSRPQKELCSLGDRAPPKSPGKNAFSLPRLGALFVKSAVGTNPRAKRNVHVDVPERLTGSRAVVNLPDTHRVSPSPLASFAQSLFWSPASRAPHFARWRLCSGPGPPSAGAARAGADAFRSYIEPTIRPRSAITSPNPEARPANGQLPNVCAVTRQPDVASAWRSLIAPNDRIGIKISAAGGELFTTHRDIVNAIVDALVAAGHPRSHHRLGRALGGIKEAGYTRRRRLSVKIDYAAGRLRSQRIFFSPVPREIDLGDFEYVCKRRPVGTLSDTQNRAASSHFSSIVASDVTKIINVPVMSDSSKRPGRLPLQRYDSQHRQLAALQRAARLGFSGVADLYTIPRIGQKLSSTLWTGC